VDFDGIFSRWYPPLFRYLNRLTGSEDTADELAQESFVRLLSHPLPEDEARRWLFTVATNLVRDGARSVRTRERILAGAGAPRPEPPPLPDEVAERREAVAAVRMALAELPERDRAMLLMREEGFRYTEIAEAVGVAPGSVGTLLVRAAKRFAEVYRAQESGR
jgi:RNA polymerase sigma-70 factor (ECF subfamily)